MRSHPTGQPPSPEPGEYPRILPRVEQPDDRLFDYELLGNYVRFVLRAPLRRKMLAAGSFLGVMALTVLLLWAYPKQYQASARLLAQRNPMMWTLSNPSLAQAGEADPPSRAARETVLRHDNLVALLKQTNFIEKSAQRRSPAVRGRDWLRAAITGTTPTEEERLDQMVSTLDNRLWVDVSGTEGSVSFTFEWPDPELAYELVEAAVQNFLEVRHSQEIAMIGETIAILEGHAARMETAIQSQLEQVDTRTRGTHRSPASGSRSGTQPRVRESDDVARLRAILSAKQRALADLESFRQRRQAEIQAQMEQSKGVYSERHPALLTLRDNLQALAGPSPQALSLRQDIQEIEQQIVALGGTLDPAGAAAGGLPIVINSRLGPSLDDDPRQEYERTQLRELVAKYANLRERIDAARLQLDTARAAFKYRYVIIAPPQLPKKPVRPKPLVVLGAGFVGGIVLAFVASTISVLRSGRFIEQWQVERNLDLKLLT